jgi:hypothetical protein
VRADAGGGEDDTVGPEGGPGLEFDGVHAHDSIMEQVRLHNASPVDRRPVAEGDEVGLGNQ